jgi:hypothetical protein
MWRILALVLLLSLVVRLVLILQMGNRYYFADTLEYQNAAQSLLAGHGPGQAFPRAPVYPAFMALGFWLFGGTYIGVRLLQLALGMGLIGLASALALRIGRPSHALLTAWFAAAAPTLVFTTGMLYPTVLYSVLLLGITFVARELDQRPGILRGALLGVLIALAFMTDQIVIAPILAILAWLAWGCRRHGARLALAIVVALAVAGLVVTPIVRYYEHAYGRAPIFMEKAQTTLWFVRSDPHVAGLRAVHDSTSHFVALTSRQFVAREWGLLRDQTVPYLMDYISEFVHFFKPMPDRIFTQNVYTSGLSKLLAGAYFIPVLLLALIGLIAGAARARDRLLLVLVPLATAAIYSLFFTQMRYRIPVEPHLLILAALGGTRLLPRLSALVTGTLDETARVPALDAAGSAAGYTARVPSPAHLDREARP